MAKTSKHIGAGVKRAKKGVKTPKKAQNDMFTFCIKQKIGVECVREHRFHPDRLWRFDYAIPSLRIAIEIDGGVSAANAAALAEAGAEILVAGSAVFKAEDPESVIRAMRE